MSPRPRNPQSILIGLLALVAVVALGSGAVPHRHSPVDGTVRSHVAHDLAPVKHHIESLINARLRQTGIEHVAVYFRAFDNGATFGIDEQFRFAPASLMKVPVMIAYLKMAENNPGLLQEQLYYDGQRSYSVIQGFKPHQQLQAGANYTIDDLIHRMIACSDNNALVLLLQRIDHDLLKSVLRDLEIDYQPSADGGRVSLASYAGTFQALYAASYLNRELSERALHYLSEEEFRAGLIAGVPRGTRVAAKFGEWAFGNHSELRQLQEFGLIYHPDGPYLLGVSAQGRDIDALAGVIRDISQQVYRDIAALHHHNS